MKKKTTRRSLLLSALSLLMCVSMLIGSTFAWFTDSVTSANNIIKSGNLDIELEYWNGTAWVDVNGKSDILSNKLWEPGVTEVAYLRVANAGSLALKYQLGINIVSEKEGVNVAGDPFKLSDYIEFGVVEDVNGETGKYDTREDAIADLDTVKKISAGYTKADSLESKEELYLALVVYMPTSVDNKANHNGTDIPEINLGINVVATQHTFEKDSFDENYDKEAKFPVVETTQKAAGQATEIEAEKVTIDIPKDAPAGEYTLEITNKNVDTDETTGKTTVSYDISLSKNGVKITTPEGGIEYEVNIEVGKNLDVSAVTHKGAAVEHYSYDPITGIVTFKTASFSPFAVVYKEADDKTVYAPATPEAAEKLKKENVVAVDENGNEYTSITAAVKSGATKLYFKEGADLGTVTHLDVANDLVIYGNGAYISGGERDLAIDTYVKLTKDITVTVYNLHGVAFWGQRNTAYTANLNLYNCNDISRVYINGTSGVNNIGIYNCTASKGNAETYKNLVGDTVVYSNANGKLVIDGCTFTNIGCPVNLNHKVAGEQTVIVTNSTFVDCSTEGTAAYYAPIRLYNSAEGANQTLTVEGNTFTYAEGKAPVNKADVLLNAKHNGVDAAGTIKADVQISANVVCGENVAFAYTIANAKDLAYFAAEVNKGEEYYGNTFEGKTVLLTANIDLGGAEWTPIGYFGNTSKQFKGTFDGQGHTVSNFKITQKSPDREGKNRSSIGFFGNVNGTIKNLIIENATVKVTNDGRFVGGIIGRLNGGLVENCKLVNSYVEGSAWQIGGIVGQVNAGTIQACVVEKTTVAGKAGVGAVAGFQMDAKETTINNCTVTNCAINQNGSYGGDYDDMFAAVLGCVNNSGATVNINNCTVTNTTVKGVQSSAMYGYSVSGAKLTVDGVAHLTTADALVAVVKNGGTAVLATDIEMKASVAISNANFVLDGNGHTITQAADCTNTTALFDITGGKATIQNVTFDGVKDGAVVRTVDVEFNAYNVTAQNSKHTQVQGLFRLLGKSTIENCTFENNNCAMVITQGFDTNDQVDPMVVKNSVFKGNTCSGTAVLYYANGSAATIDGNQFVDNTVNTTGNAATVYLGFKKNCTVTNNIFKDNAVTTAAKRSAGALMVGNAATIKNNYFVGNTVTNGSTNGNDVCASVYYSDIDLSGNYWGGKAPVENDDYFVEYPNYNKVIINDYLTTYGN